MKRITAWASLCAISVAAAASAQDGPASLPPPRPGVSLIPKLDGVGAAARLSGVPQLGGAKSSGPRVAAAPESTSPAKRAPSAAPPVATAAAKEAETDNLPQFDKAVEYKPRGASSKVSFSLEDADLGELVRVIGQLTGKRFIFGPKVKSIKASVYSPQKITVAEAYQAFLTILDQNGLTVVPHGRFLKIIDTEGAASQGTPMIGPGGTVPSDERYVTHLKRLSHMTAEEGAALLGKFKSKTASVEAYAPGNLLIITDTGANIRRMLSILDQIDVGSAGDQVWIEPMHYAAASDVANRVGELFDVKAGGSAGKKGGGASGDSGSGDLHISKVISDDRTNSLVIVATEKAYLRMLEFIKRIDVPQTGEGEVHVVALQHADAVDLVKTLNEVVQSGQGGSGPAPQKGGNVQANTSVFEGPVRVAADKSTNSVLITSSLRDFASLRSVIDRLDQSRRQVFIDAVIMDLNVSRAEKLGFKWHGGLPFETQGSNDSLFLGGLDAAGTALPTGAGDLLQGFALGVRGPAIAGSAGLLGGLTGGTGLSIPAFGVTMQALTSDTDSDVLSTPHILATDNEDAEIRVGQDTPIQAPVGGLGSLAGLAGGAAGAAGGAAGLLGGLTGGLGGQQGQRAKVGTKIKIKPHLNDSDEVRLDLLEEISEVGAATQTTTGLGGIPVIERTANTKLVVRDQQTVVIGGLTRNAVRRSSSKVPFLGDIPLIGALFRSTTTTREKTNLVLILTPYIIKSQDDLRKVYERKMQERQEFLDRYFVFTADREYTPPKDWTRTNGLVETMRQAALELAEKQRMDELTKPREFKTHTPGTPLDMPAVGTRASNVSDGGEEPVITPAARVRPKLNVDRLER